MRTFVFACIHNAGRSQISAALFNHLCDATKARAVSAGTQPGTRVHPVVVQAMQELGIDLSTATPQLLNPELLRGAEMLITMGCGDECPYAPGIQRMDWPLPDPANLNIAAVRAIRQDIEQRVRALLFEKQLHSQPA